jgi:hypothetical protein
MHIKRNANNTKVKYLTVVAEANEYAQMQANALNNDIATLTKQLGLNLTIKPIIKDGKQGYKITHELKNPWAGFVKTDSLVHGRG